MLTSSSPKTIRSRRTDSSSAPAVTPHLTEALRYLRSLGKRLTFITNKYARPNLRRTTLTHPQTHSATRSRRQYLEKFHALGLTHVTLDEIFTCGSASAYHLKNVIVPELEAQGRPTGIYLIGQQSMEEELREEGLSWTGGTVSRVLRSSRSALTFSSQDPEDDVLLPPQDFSTIVPDPSIGIVLFSFQMRINYKQLAKGELGDGRHAT